MVYGVSNASHRHKKRVSRPGVTGGAQHPLFLCIIFPVSQGREGVVVNAGGRTCEKNPNTNVQNSTTVYIKRHGNNIYRGVGCNLVLD